MGVLLIDGGGIGKIHGGQSLQGRGLPLCLGHFGVDAQHFFHLRAHLHQRVHGAHRLLEHNADGLALELSQLLAVNVQKLRSVQ